MGMIQDCWLDFSKKVLPNNAPLLQKEEMEKAFFGGAAGVLLIITQMSRDEVDEEQCTILVDGMFKELQSYSTYHANKAADKLMDHPIGNG